MRGELQVASEQGEVLVEQRQLQLRASDDAADAVFQDLFLAHAVNRDGGGAGAQRPEHLQEAAAGKLLARRADDGVVDAVPELCRQVG